MKTASFVFALAAAGSVLAATPALAAPAEQRVRLDDIELTSPEGQAELQRRLDRAAYRACLYGSETAMRAADKVSTCYRETREQVAVEVAQIVTDRQLGG